MSLNRGMDKEDVAHICNRIFARIYNGQLLGHKRERNCAICRDMDGPRDGHIA